MSINITMNVQGLEKIIFDKLKEKIKDKSNGYRRLQLSWFGSVK